jgi:hypothetical protein
MGALSSFVLTLYLPNRPDQPHETFHLHHQSRSHYGVIIRAKFQRSFDGKVKRIYYFFDLEAVAKLKRWSKTAVNF